MSRYKLFYLSIVLLAFLSGCGPAFKLNPPSEETGFYPTSSNVEAKDIQTYLPFSKIDKVKFIFFKGTYSLNDKIFENFMRTALVNIGFENILNEEELSKLIISNNLSDSLPSISDLVSLNRLSHITGQFLYMKANLSMPAECWFRFDISIIDPLSGEKLLDVSRLELNDLDLDKEVNYPILNLLINWKKDSLKTVSEDISEESFKQKI